jgi:hypothetical protein
MGGVAALLFCPKLALLPPLIALAGLPWSSADRRRLLGRGAAFGAGLAAAGALTAVYFLINRIGLGEAYDGVVRYNALINRHQAFGFGMAQALAYYWYLLVPALLGAGYWVARTVRRGEQPDPYLAGTLAWLALQPALVAAPHKQYDAPWLLFAGCFIGLAGEAVTRASRGLGVAAFVAAGLGMAALAGRSVWVTDPGPVQHQLEVIRWIRQVAGPDDRVVVDPRLHPLDRFDPFYFWFNTYDPGGFDGEHAVAAIADLTAKVSEPHYRAELEAHPPALVLIGPSRFLLLYPERQQRALLDFMGAYRYPVVAMGGERYALHPAAYERAARLWLLPPPASGPVETPR